MGVSVRIGREFAPSDDAANAARVVVVSDDLWRTELGASSAAVGATMILNGQSYTIVGITQPGFRFPDDGSRAWIPARSVYAPFWETEGAAIVPVVGRMRDAQGVSDVQLDLERLEKEVAGSRERQKGALVVEALGHHLSRDILPRLRILDVAATLLLLLGCANVGNLVLARSSYRANELALRRILGADTRHVIGSVLSEAVLIVLLGALSGVGLAVAALRNAERFVLNERHSTGAMAFGGTEIFNVCCIAVALVGALASVGAVQQKRDQFALALRDSARGTSYGARRVRGALTAISVSITLVLLLGGGALANAYSNLADTRIGVELSDVYLAPIRRPVVVYTMEDRDATEAFMARVLRATRSFERRAAISTQAPASGNDVVAYATADVGDSIRVGVQGVSDDYFDVLRIPLLRGESFAAVGTQGAPIAVVDDRLERRLFPGGGAIGKTISLGGLAIQARIVGVSRSIRQGGATREGPVQVYLPYHQLPWPWVTLLVRSPMDANGVRKAIESAVSSVDESQSIQKISSLKAAVSSDLDKSRFFAALLASLGGAAILLTGLGLYGGIAVAISQRTREIGIRKCFGATPSRIVRDVVGEVVAPTAVGIIAGLSIAFSFRNMLAALLYGVSPTDWMVTIGAVAVVSLVSVGASLPSAVRAAALEPANALRRD
jgi:predicted permease